MFILEISLVETMEDQRPFVFNAASSSSKDSSMDKSKRKWIVVKKGGAGRSPGDASSVSSATTFASTSMLQSLVSAATNSLAIIADVSTSSSLAPFCASSTSSSVPHMDVSKTASSSIMPVSKTASLESLVGNLPDAEKTVQVESSGESSHSDNDTTQKEETNFSQTGTPAPNDVENEKEEEKSQTGTPAPNEVENEKEEEESEEVSDPAPNLPLPLIHISRILKGMNQSPHFLPLRECSELLREILMAAWDQTFEEAVEEIHGVTKADGFWDWAIEMWKVMGELQGMGYNVIPMRRRLVEMAEVANGLKQSKKKIFKLKIRAYNRRMQIMKLKYMINYFQESLESEEVIKAQVLDEVDKMENELYKYDDIIANLAKKSFSIGN